MQLIDETEGDLRALIERDFGQLASPPTNREVVDWMHYRARLIPQRLRTVTVSQEVVAQMSSYPTVGRLKTEFENGGDVSPWLSDRVRKRKADALADLMFNDWQISHFHLGRHFVSPTKVARGKQLLFALVKADRAVSSASIRMAAGRRLKSSAFFSVRAHRICPSGKAFRQRNAEAGPIKSWFRCVELA